jgi:hypothetical protein
MLDRTGLRDEIGADNVFVSIRSAIATCTSAFGNSPSFSRVRIKRVLDIVGALLTGVAIGLGG